MRVVIDTNVLVSAVFKDKSPETIIRFVVAHPDFEWVASEAILNEYKTVLARSKFGLPAFTPAAMVCPARFSNRHGGCAGDFLLSS